MRARRLSQAVPAIVTMAAAIVALSPETAAADLTVHGTAGPSGSTCALVDGRYADPKIAVTCGLPGKTANAIYMTSTGTAANSARGEAWIDAPSGISINTISVNYCSNMNNKTSGWGGGSFWGPGSVYGNEWPAATCTSSSTGQTADYPEGVPRYGFQVVCGQANGCTNADLYVPSFTLSATETAQPSLTAVGAGNIWYQGGRWLWNPPSDPWSASLVGSDVSGVCKYEWSVDGASVDRSYPQNDGTWQQCPNNTGWNTSVDTAAYPNGAVTYQVADWNAAGNATVDTERLYIDNRAPSVSLTPAPGPSRGATVTVDVQAAAGPSGLAGLACSDNGAALAITGGTVRVSRNGTHHVVCTAANNAIDPQGQHNVGTAAVIVKIATSRVPVLSRRRAHGHVNVPVVIGWSWWRARTTLRHITFGKLSRRAHVILTCRGRGCPWKKLRAPSKSIRKLTRRLAGDRFTSTDTVMLTITVPHRISERARIRMRTNRVPLVRRLS